MTREECNEIQDACDTVRLYMRTLLKKGWINQPHYDRDVANLIIWKQWAEDMFYDDKENQ